jgi:penicillin amidase
VRLSARTRFVLLTAALIVLVPLALAHVILRASLPQFDGRVGVSGPAKPVSVTRDALGIPTIQAASRADLAFGTGFVHGQDRFFQMDLSRRLAAGELSELFGKAALSQDRKARLFDFRAVARHVLEQATPTQRALLEAYARGVNAGLEGLRARPWEYWVLGAKPALWQPEDSFLVVYAMWWDLQYGDLESEILRRTLNDRLGGAECEDGWRCGLKFFYPARTPWDAPNVEDEAEMRTADARDAEPVAIPGQDVINVRTPARARATHAARGSLQAAALNSSDALNSSAFGSNNWALAGRLSSSGAALVANDMHLDLRVPNVWYRARLRLPASASLAALDLNGVTLPGGPLVVAGSNGHVAWGFTDSYGHWLTVRPQICLGVNASSMRTPRGDVPLNTTVTSIHVHGHADVEERVQSSAAGVLYAVDAAEQRCWFVHWLAQVPAATNLNMLEFERATSAQQLLAIAPRVGIPHENLVAGDSAGHIGWAIAGRVPVGTGAGRLDGVPEWRSADAPQLLDPPLGRLWSANARPIDREAALAAIGGDEAVLGAGYALGARAQQIRDGLLALHSPASPADMLAVQLDDRALFLARWRQLLVALLDADAVRGQPRRAQFAHWVASWDARAGVDSIGYRLVRAFRTVTANATWQMIAAALDIDSARRPTQFEQPLWALVSRQPLHLLAADYPSWRAFLLAQVDATIAELEKRCGALERCRWGARNPVAVRHPLSSALPFLARLIDMPILELPGDYDMPRVQDGIVGASERFAVSPGHEAEGYLDIAGGQSGHPLSPYYRAGFREWSEGRPLPFLPGPERHALLLNPLRGAVDSRP